MAHSKVMSALRGCQDSGTVLLGNFATGAAWVSGALRRLLRVFRIAVQTPRLKETIFKEAGTFESRAIPADQGIQQHALTINPAA